MTDAAAPHEPSPSSAPPPAVDLESVHHLAQGESYYHEELRWGRIALVCAGILGAAVAGALALKATRKAPPRKPSVTKKVGVQVVAAGPQRIVPQVQGLARARPRRRVVISAEVGGQVAWIHEHLEDGAHLGSGTVVLQIDPVDQRAQLARVQATLASARAEVARLEASARYLSERLQVAQETLALEQRELARVEGLESGGINSQRELEQARRSVLRARDSLIGLDQTSVLLAPQLRAARARVQEQEAQRVLAQLDLERTTLRLPFAGQLAAVSVEAHQRVAPGTVLFELWDDGAVEVPVVLPLAEASLLAPDLRATPLQQVEVVLEQQGEVLRWPGQLIRFEPVDAETQTVRAVVRVEDASRGGLPLSAGMFVQVELAGPPRDLPLALPVEALQEGDRVYLLQEGKLAVRRVQRGRRIGRWVTITGGLAAGEQVIVSPLERAVEGIPLEVTGDEAPRSEPK